MRDGLRGVAMAAGLLLWACSTPATSPDDAATAAPSGGSTTAVVPTDTATTGPSPEPTRQGPSADRSDAMTDPTPDATTHVAPPDDPGRDDASAGAGAVVLEPAAVRPGDTVTLTLTFTFPGGRERGLDWVLQRRDGEAWVDAFWLVSDANGSAPRWAPASDQSFAVEAIGIAGPGPDHVVVPDLVAPGTYRLCTNDRDPACADLVVRHPGHQPGGPRPTGPVVPPPRD